MSDTPPPPLSDDARRLLDMVREEPVDQLQVKRVKQRLAVAVGLGALVPGPSASTTTASSSISAKLALLVGAGAITLGVVAYLTSKANDTPTPPAPAASSVEQPVASAPVPPSPPEVVTAQPAPVPSAPPTTVIAKQWPPKIAAPTPSVSESAPVVDTLAAERALLAAAQQDLSAKNYPKARETYEKHLAEYPHGVLHTEATVGRVLAMCGQKDPSASAEAKKLLETNPPAALAKRVRTACEIE